MSPRGGLVVFAMLAITGVTIGVGGCPLNGPTWLQPEGGRSAAGSGGRGGHRGEDLDAIRASLDVGKEFRLPPPPSEETLCALKFTEEDDEKAGSSFAQVKQIIGVAGSEAQSRSEAGLQYRFSDGTGASFRFEWREELEGPYVETDVYPDYYLAGADVQGRPYPRCWPHVDPHD